MKRIVLVATSVAAIVGLTAGITTVSSAAAPAVGGACSKKQVNKTVGTLICKKEAGKYVFRAVEVTTNTAAPAPAPSATPAADSNDLKGTKITFYHWRAEEIGRASCRERVYSSV